MGSASYIQANFLGGERSQVAQGRIDLPDYRTGMNVCLNGLPIEEGAWTRRPGFQYGAHTRGGSPARVVSYAFQQNSPYTMEFTDGHLRFFAGPRLATTNDQQAVLAISTANPAVMQTTTATTWLTGDQGMFNTLGAADPLLLNRQFILTRIDSTHFSLADAITGANIDGSTLGTFVSGNFTRTLDLVTPFGGGTWSSLRSIQIDSAAMLLQGGNAPQVLAVVSPPIATLDATFALAPANFWDGPYLDPISNAALVTPSATSGIIALTLSFNAYSATTAYSLGDYVVSSSVSYKSIADQNFNNTPVSSPAFWAVVSPAQAVGPNGFVSTDVGRHIRLNSEPALWASATTYAAGASVTYGANTYWTSLTAANTGNIPGVDLVHWAINPVAANWTWGKVTSLLNIIPGTVSGVAHIGSLTNNGGLNAAFDGNLAKTSSASAQLFTNNTATQYVLRGYVGQNYSGTVATAYPITSATVYSTIDLGTIAQQVAPGVGAGIYGTLELYGSHSAPTSYNNGTLLGSTTLDPLVPYYSATASIGNGPTVIVSADQTTAWEYVWVAIEATIFTTEGSSTLIVTTSQVQFLTTPSGSASAGVNLQVLGPPLLNTNAIRTWRLGLYNGTVGWPTCGTYHEGRLWLSGSVANRVDASQPNQPWASKISFAPTSSNGTVSDANGISYTFNAPDVNSILWMKPDQQGIVVGTEKGEWLIQATSFNQPLTPTSIQAHRVTRIGSSIGPTAEPVQTDHTTVFIQRYARKIMEYFPDVFSGKFSAPNIASQASHLTSRVVDELAYQQSVSPVIWARCDDGSLLGCSYKRDSLMSSQGPTFAGWHQHTLGGGRTISSLTIGPSVDGTLDTLSAVTTNGTTSHIVFLNNIFQENDAATSANFLDDSVAPTVAQSIVFGGASTMQCTGLWHLNGKTVTVFAGGLDCGDWPVTNGKLNVVYGGDPAGLFTPAFVSSFSGSMPVVVGFTYNSDGQIVRPATPQESGARNGPALGKKRRTQQFAALLNATQGISFGTTFAKLNKANFKTPGGVAYAANALYSGIHWDSLTDDYSFDSMFCWRISRPYPATICAIEGFLETQDK